jgi:hypothetical protein
MTDLQGALEARLFDRLSAEIVGAAVHQHVPQDVQGSLVIIGEIGSEDAGAKGRVLERFDIEIATEVRSTGRKDLNALQAQVHAALHEWQPDSTLEVKFGRMIQTSRSGQLGGDGSTYFGSQRFAIFVQPIQ